MKGIELAAEIKFNLDYARWIDEENRLETWDDSVNRVMEMHRKKFAHAFYNPRFVELFDRAHQAYKNKYVLGSQRALQFGGDPMLKHNARMFNCVGGYIDKIKSFQEIMYFLLCGCGVGFSVQYKHINKLPKIEKRKYGVKTFIVPDSIEGWSDAFGILISSFVSPSDELNASFPEWCGYEVRFDLSLIRPEGALISGGFKAPGPEGLRKALLKVEALLEKTLNESNVKIKPIVAYDIIMHMSDAVLSGGVRRSATIALFSPEDNEMMTAKTGNWYNENPQRARSNNSVVLVRSKTTKEKFDEIFECIKSFGEPGFFFVEDEEELTNPCVTADTIVDTNLGKMTMLDLVNKFQNGIEIQALSYNEVTCNYEYKLITNAAKTREDAQLVELVVEDDFGKIYTIKCTPEHKILTRNRSYVEAKDLTNEDDIIVN